jgi:gas vesicle protein GvpL/GvpF
MSRALAYCGFCHRPEISLPSRGVQSAAVKIVAEGELRLLWSEVEWPFAPERMQKSAVEFHEVVHHVFRQAAVVPFRLLSVFADEGALAGFAAQHAEAFLADLERLKDCVQMECVIYPAPGRAPRNDGSGTAYLQEKAELLRAQEEQVNAVRESLGTMAREIRVREGKNGMRVFVLAARGREDEFRSAVERVAAPEMLARRMSGPWPAAEFLSEGVRMPQAAGTK